MFIPFLREWPQIPAILVWATRVPGPPWIDVSNGYLYDIPPASAKENRHTRTVFPHAVFLDINIISNTLTYISQTIYLYIYIPII